MIQYNGKFYCSTKEAAVLLDIPEYTIRRLINSDEASKKIKAEILPGYKKKYSILFDDLFEYAKNNKKEHNFQENIKKLRIEQPQKESLLELIGKALRSFVGGSFITPAFTNNVIQDNSLMSENNTADIVSFSLGYFENQTEFLDKSKEELEYWLEQTKVSIQGINIDLKKAKEEDEEDRLKVMEHALEIQKLKIKNALSKCEKVLTK